MMPAAFAGLEGQMWLWLVAMIRPGAAFFAAPLFGMAAVPVQLRLVISLAIGMAGYATTPFFLPPDGVTSVAGFAMILGEVLAGAAMGFAVQIGFSAALLAGETIGNASGLGFASMIDPHSNAPSTAVAQFLSILATFLFLSIGGHLILARIIVESYHALPVGGAWPAMESLRGLVMFGGEIFAMGLAIALPVGFALILVQIIMALLARSAPAMNIFAVGLPATLLAAIILLAIAAPAIGEGIQAAIERGLDEAQALAVGK
ncbi:flagellar biosynthetic protein FliR [Sphingomonas vulcanisoli]